MSKYPVPTPIYHITSFANLATILNSGGLRCCDSLKANQTEYTNIAHENIQDRRAAKRVTCGPGGNLHNYVLFYFAPRSPMLYSINEGKVSGYDKGQEPIVHLVSTAQSVEADGRSFVFTDGHATMFLSRMFDHLNDLDQIDWEIMPQRLWHDYDVKYPDRKRKRQSEFLVYH